MSQYNSGLHIIPNPNSLIQRNGSFKLNSQTAFKVDCEEIKRVVELVVEDMRKSTGFKLSVGSNGNIEVKKSQDITHDEGYKLTVSEDNIMIEYKAPNGAFYGLQTLKQLLPAEIENTKGPNNVLWELPCVTIVDQPRINYRGFMIDPCRHFMKVSIIYKFIDVLALYKFNRLHIHLIDDQGWRIEIKKYPKLVQVGSKRIECEGHEYGGFYTQEELKKIVHYCSERFITVIPEIECPGHVMSAIASYPEYACKPGDYKVRNIWGIEDIVMCAGKEEVFRFYEDLFQELVDIFPSDYFHIGGDECPKVSWKNCDMCQKRISEEDLTDPNGIRTPEECLQSYFIRRIEGILAKYGKKIIGWDEILEGGLSQNATVMSWRGEEGGITAANQDHYVIMTPSTNGLYLDHYQGDKKVEPCTIGGFSPLSKTYSYDPVPKALVSSHKEKYVYGVQCNLWSEYMFEDDQPEYMAFPRALAVSEVGWTNPNNKSFDDFQRRLLNHNVRLDFHNIIYHIPIPEQEGISSNDIAFIDKVLLAFKTSRPVYKIVYTLDGKEPNSSSQEYKVPIEITSDVTIRIRSILEQGTMGKERVIKVHKTSLLPSKNVMSVSPGLKGERFEGQFMNVKEFEKRGQPVSVDIKDLKDIICQVGDTVKYTLENIKPYGMIATGYIDIPSDGIYYFATDFEELHIDGQLLISNGGLIKRHSALDKSIGLAKGLHELKIIFLGHIIKGWPSYWNNQKVSIRKEGQSEYKIVSPEMLKH